MPNYQNSKIYKIINDSLPDEDPYIGSTTQHYLCNRMKDHSFKARNGGGCSSIALFKKGTPKIILIKNFPCNSKEELIAEERKYIEENNCVNKEIPGGTPSEWRKRYVKKNPEKIKEWAKKSYYKHHEKNKEKRRERWSENKDEYNKSIKCECGGSYTKRGKNRHLKTQKHINYIS